MRVVLVTLLLLSCVVAAQATADDMPTAAELKARSAAAYGKAPDNFRSIITSTGSLGDTRVVLYRLGKDMRETFDRGGLHSEFGTYHGESWRQNNNGLTIAVASPAPAAPSTLEPIVTRVSTPVDAYVVSLLDERKAGRRIYYDPATYRVIRTEDLGPTGTVVNVTDAFAQYGTLTRVKAWTVTSRDAQLAQTYTESAFDAGVVTDADVQPRGTLRALVEFPPATTGVDLPVQFNRGDVMVRLMFGTRGVDFVLDTGASGIFIDEDVARELGLTLINAQSVVTAQRYTSYNAVIPEIRIGSLAMHNVAVAVGPLPWNSDGGIAARGLLGFDFLAQLGVTIDYEHRTVHVTPAGDYVPPSGPATFPIEVRMDSGQPATTVRVGDDVLARHIIFDTGWTGQLAFFDSFAHRNPQLFTNQISYGSINGVGGRINVDYFVFPSIQIGNMRFTKFVGSRTPPGSYAFADGVIGNQMLKLFTVGLDYTHGTIYLTPNKLGESERR